jgi:hypothetical protein
MNTFGIGFRNIVAEEARALCRAYAFRIDYVLDSDWNAVQRTSNLAADNVLLRLGRFFTRAFMRHSRECIQHRIQFIDPFQMRFSDFYG